MYKERWLKDANEFAQAAEDAIEHMQPLPIFLFLLLMLLLWPFTSLYWRLHGQVTRER
jgi:hypothetical protein